jgi:hypothetical protein
MLAQYAFASKDIISFIQKSDEGKEVMDHLFLEVALKGADFNEKVVNHILKEMGDIIRINIAERAKVIKADAKVCAADIKKTKTTFTSIARKALAAHRHLEGTKNRQKRRTVFLTRAEEELAHYKAFKTWVEKNAKAWKKYYATTSDNLQKVVGLLSRASSHIKSLKNDAALIELPGVYKSSLSQLSSEFDGTNDNLGGLRAVISNVFELVQKKEHISHADFRHKARSIIRHIIDRIGDFQNELAEENEAQVGLFDSLGNLFNDAVQRSNKVTSALAKQAKEAAQKITWLTVAVKGSKSLANQAKSVVQQLAAECRYHKSKAYRHDVREGKMLSVIDNLRDVIADRWGPLHTFFTQKYLESQN